MHRLLKNIGESPMRHFQKEILDHARLETKPEIPKKVRLCAKILGKDQITNYLWKYYERESERRVPFYLPFAYRKELLEHLRRYGKIPKKQMNLILIDGEDFRTELFFYENRMDVSYVTIVTPRKEYFEKIQQQAFAEDGLLVDLVTPWEDKNLRGNLVWDFTEQIQKSDCYPKGSICFLPHKKDWKIKELLQTCDEITAVTIAHVTIAGYPVNPSFAESLLAMPEILFRKRRCEEVEKWCKTRKWSVKLRVQTREKP